MDSLFSFFFVPPLSTNCPKKKKKKVVTKETKKGNQNTGFVKRGEIFSFFTPFLSYLFIYFFLTFGPSKNKRNKS